VNRLARAGSVLQTEPSVLAFVTLSVPAPRISRGRRAGPTMISKRCGSHYKCEPAILLPAHAMGRLGRLADGEFSQFAAQLSE